MREVKRVDTGLRKENQQIDLDYRVSISPSRETRQQNKSSFVLKPTEINHFTGKQKTEKDQRVIDIELKRENSDVRGREKSRKNDDELYV